MDYLLTFLEGILAFVSPCILPLLPVYVAYFAGGADKDADAARLRSTVACALAFVLGFATVFTSLGAFAGTLGTLLVRHRQLVSAVCGLLVMFMGLNYLGVIRVSVLDYTWRPQADVVPRSPLTSFLFGLVFAIGWTPCVGTFLASALSMAAASGTVVRGVSLLACFSAGLGVPFVLAAVLLDQLQGAFAWIRTHYTLVNRVCGALLVGLGILMTIGLFP